MSLSMLQGFARVAALLPGFVLRVGAKVSTALADGSLSLDEVESVAVAASTEAGDLKVKVNGVDIIDDQAQTHLAAFVGRIAGGLVGALRK